jgi:DNA-binding transcriptional regulator YbjK
VAGKTLNGLDRSALIADSGIRIVARDGVRALTHRAVDREAGLPQGSTSYYAPTRSALVELIVSTLAERSIADAGQASLAISTVEGRSRGVDVDGLAALVAGLIETYASRAVEMRTRYALLLELDSDDPSRVILSQESPVQQQMVELVIRALEGLGVQEAPTRALELFVLTEALLAHSVIVGGDRSTAKAVLGAYLGGLTITR